MFPNFNELPPLREAASERLDLESGVENGKKEICIRNLEVIAAAFDITISQLMSRI